MISLMYLVGLNFKHQIINKLLIVDMHRYTLQKNSLFKKVSAN